MRFKLGLILGIGLFLITDYFYRKRLVKLEQKKQLVVGIASHYAPFVSMNAQGDYEGFDIDIATALAQTLGKELVLKDLGGMTSLLTALNQKQIDVIIWGLSITPARLKKLAMVHYYGDNLVSYPLIFWNQIPDQVVSLADLTCQTVCVEPNSAQQAFLDHYSGLEQLPVEKIDDALLNIQYGKAVAALVEPAIAKKFMAKYPQIKALALPLDAQLQEQGIGIALMPDHVVLIEQIQLAIAALKAEGVIDRLAQKWGV